MRKLIALFMLLWSSMAYATTFADLKFGAAQFSDTQWNVSACLYTNTCQIYSLSGIGTSWNTGSPYHLSSTQYIQFSPSGNPSYPWTMKVYNSNGTLAANLGNGKLTVQGLGTDSSGHHFFFFTNANYNGTVFSTDYGFPNSSGFSFTGTLNPTTTQTDSFASSGSTTPLNAGQTYTSAPTYPTATITNTEQVYINQTNVLNHNSIYITQTGGDFTTVNVAQNGDNNSIRGIGGGSYTINGGSNTLSVKQGSQTIQGNNNLVEGSVTGNVNSMNDSQQGNNNYLQTSINGSYNSLLALQTGGNKAIFAKIIGNNNNITVNQLDTGNHFLELNIPTNNNTVSVTQSGAAQKMFSLTLNNNNIGVTVTQDNATTSDSAAMSITCTSGPCTGYTYTKH